MELIVELPTDSAQREAAKEALVLKVMLELEQLCSEHLAGLVIGLRMGSLTLCDLDLVVAPMKA